MNNIIQNCFVLLSLLPLLWSCGSTSGSQNKNEATTEVFSQKKTNGKFSVDHATAEELKIMENTIGNFTQMIKRQPENLSAYNEYGNLLQMHIDRVNKYCRLDETSKTELCKNLNLIKEKIPQLQKGDARAASLASKDVYLLFSKIDSAFAYRD